MLHKFLFTLYSTLFGLNTITVIETKYNRVKNGLSMEVIHATVIKLMFTNYVEIIYKDRTVYRYMSDDKLDMWIDHHKSKFYGGIALFDSEVEWQNNFYFVSKLLSALPNNTYYKKGYIFHHDNECNDFTIYGVLQHGNTKNICSYEELTLRFTTFYYTGRVVC